MEENCHERRLQMKSRMFLKKERRAPNEKIDKCMGSKKGLPGLCKVAIDALCLPERESKRVIRYYVCVKKQYKIVSQLS